MLSSGFFDGDAEYGQEEFNRYFANIYESGISIDDAGEPQYEVVENNGKVQVKEGFAILRGFYAYNNAPIDLDVTIPLNSQRIDRVVLRADLLAGPASLILKEGTDTTPPQLQRDEEAYEISLAAVTIKQDGTILIDDERMDGSVCGQIRPKNLVEYQAFLEQCKERFETWFSSQQSGGWRNIYIQSTRPVDAVEGSIWIKTE